MAENKKYDFPTEVITLPSQGKCYPTEHPLSKGEIEIKYMTAKEEEILASQNLIKKGVVLDMLFESIIADKSIDIDDIAYSTTVYEYNLFDTEVEIALGKSKTNKRSNVREF